MAQNTNPIFVLVPKAAGVTWTNSDAAGTAKDLISAGTNGSRIGAICATSTDTSAVDMLLLLNDGSTDFLVGTVTVNIGAGYTGSAQAQNLLSTAVGAALSTWVAADGSLLLPTGWKIRAENVTQVTSGKTLTLVVMQSGDY